MSSPSAAWNPAAGQRAIARIAKSWSQKLFPAAGLIVAHVAPFALFFTGMRAADWLFFAVLYALVNYAIGLSLHRYFAHRSFRTSRVFQFLLAWLSATFFGDPIGFTGKHRLHHKYSDQPGDVHSPRQGIWQCWIGSLFDDGREETEIVRMARDWTRFPELRCLHRFYFVPGVTLAAALWSLFGLRAFALYCLAFLVGLHGPSAVNYFCHLGNNRRFDTGDGSTNRLSLALLLFGEGWHNNHHRYPLSARSGFAWYEVDVHYYTIKLLEQLGLVWNVKSYPAWLSAQADAPPRAGGR
ncbi:MAG TPA: acyl-CoA desaturase [Candidatus Nitrosotenuis sp.]|nr:acyl-CoA desaturase [Candidatus Nitrosotenuis sp.]